jgi:hypothetical protein
MVRPFALVLSIESHSSNKILRNNTQQSTYIIISAECREMLAGGWGAGGRSGIHYGWDGSTNPPYSTINYLLEVAGI